MISYLRIAIAVFMLILSLAPIGQLAAAELGKVISRSQLDQALKISMELKLAEGEDVNAMQCDVAQPDDFSSMGMSKPSFTSDIQCHIEANHQSSALPRLVLQSQQAISASVFHLLLVISSNQDAHQLRDFLVVLDPVSNANLPLSATQDESSPSQSASSAQLYQVQANETLMNVARQFGVAEIEFNQFMLAVLQLNPNAFIHQNIHLLKQGSLLKIPSQQQWQSIDRDQALQQVQQSNLDWRVMRQSSLSEQSDQDNQTPVDSLQANDEAKPEHDSQARDIVRLSSAAGANSKVLGLTVQEEINALRDEIAAHEVSIKEANLKTAALEKQIQEMQKLILMKDQALEQQERLRPWWSKTSLWLGNHPWALLSFLLALMLASMWAVYSISKRRTDQALQALLADIAQSNAHLNQQDISPQAVPTDAASVLQKTQQLIQDIDLDWSHQSNASPQSAVSTTKKKQKNNIDTQFDLVASYIDMGDLIGASTLLQQIIQDGNASQQSKARKMLSALK